MACSAWSLYMGKNYLSASFDRGGHYKHHTEEYRAAVTELLMKASALYTSRKRLNDYSVGTSEDSDTPYSSCNLHKTAVSSSDRLGRISADPANHFFLPSSMEYHESSSEVLKPELFNMPSVESAKNPDGLLGKMLYDVCVPKNVEGWDFKLASIDGQRMHFTARQHGLKKALPEEQDEIEDLKMGLLDMHNRLEYINTALVEQQEELEVVKNAKEEKTLATS
ncbi:hypothetical protein TRIUR3_24937 [Triticum urartu]|uniref:Uncharacterized protein n=1 Tax=Triticum urartu TaxID=4572 RepID=M8AWF0_TRIUA|nr:hypothetical protein TRIUR3_24937 [Triticum urartu]